jgi:hypothetical protein
MPTLDDQDDDNDDAPTIAVHGPDGDDDNSPAPCAAPPLVAEDTCVLAVTNRWLSGRCTTPIAPTST